MLLQLRSRWSAIEAWHLSPVTTADFSASIWTHAHFNGSIGPRGSCVGFLVERV